MSLSERSLPGSYTSQSPEGLLDRRQTAIQEAHHAER